ncbi:hypothetical protein TrLO_g13952 [Triparma laevis f. longispina]|uniref:Uncharacterized protein n=1 Tax=Triparma laevis f. longispina TaxID=1714387 RepID=A0A9W7C7M4_9STRA|nr:hypothetical protein TrLO_g13952 [Triparma laevis f. longispina]
MSGQSAQIVPEEEAKAKAPLIIHIHNGERTSKFDAITWKTAMDIDGDGVIGRADLIDSLWHLGAFVSIAEFDKLLEQVQVDPTNIEKIPDEAHTPNELLRLMNCCAYETHSWRSSCPALFPDGNGYRCASSSSFSQFLYWGLITFTRSVTLPTKRLETLLNGKVDCLGRLRPGCCEALQCSCMRTTQHQ